MLSVLALVSKRPGISPGQRFRLEQWEPHLRQNHGIALSFEAFESDALTDVLYAPGRRAEKAALVVKDFLRRRHAIASASSFDAVVMYREASLIGPALYERVLAHRRVPFLVDFDDAIWLNDPRLLRGANGLFSLLRFPGKLRSICRLASAVTVGNEYLASWARTHNPGVFVVPTSIDLARFPLQKLPEDGDTLHVVWTGSHSTLTHLDSVRGAFERLAHKRRVELHVICDRPQARPFAGVTTHFLRWEAAREAEQLAAGHVGIMPLPDDAFARGKCGCKALQYMAVGMPAVVSPVGVNVDIVHEGDNGMLAKTEDDWVASLDRLAGSPGLRARLGAAGRKTVEDAYSSVASAARFAAAVEHAIRVAGTPEVRAKLAGRAASGPLRDEEARHA
jgi:glycosyltransferase involved in cell wall biosynthesis